MKVLQVTTHMNIGGIGNYILHLSAALKAKGIDVRIASSGGGLEDELSGQDIAHETLGMKTKFEFSPKVFASAVSISGIIKREGFDIMHAHTRVSQVAAFLASRMTGIPYVTTCHGFFKTRLRKMFDTWGKKVIAISDGVKTHLEKDLGVEHKRIALVYTGIDMNRFSKEYSLDEIDKTRKSLDLRLGPIIGTIGRLSPVKGQRFLIEAMKDMIMKKDDIQCLIVGDGPEEHCLRDLAKSLRIEDSICFARSDLDTNRYLSLMDVFVFPSVKEGLGVALLEALASKRACVASDIGGIGTIVQNGVTGILVPVGDVKAISDAVLSLINNAALRKELGQRGKALVQEAFSLDSMAKKIIGVYREVLGFKR